MRPRLVVLKAKHCAWRGRYLVLTSRRGRRGLARVTIDPHDGVRPTLTVGLGWRSFRIGLPRVPWTWAWRSRRVPVLGALVGRLHRLSAWFWHGMDGRYGFGRRER